MVCLYPPLWRWDTVYWDHRRRRPPPSRSPGGQRGQIYQGERPARAMLHRGAARQACRPALGGREPARTGADGPGRAGKAGDLFHRYGTAGGNVLRYHSLFHRHPARRAVSGSAHRPGRQRPPRQKLVVRALPRPVPLCLRHLRPAGGKRSGVWVVCGAVQVCGVVAADDSKPGG